MAKGLMLHCGGKQATLDEVNSVVIPNEVGKRTVLLPYAEVRQNALDAMAPFGITREQYSLAREGQQMFGVIETAAHNGEMALSLGLRSSYDSSIAPGYCVGNVVFVCDNMAFHADLVISAKQTENGAHNLRYRLLEGVGAIHQSFEEWKLAVEAMKQREVHKADVNQLLMECVRKDYIAPRNIGSVLREYEQPTVEAWKQEPNTVWRLFNAVTEIAKQWSAPAQFKRTRGVSGLFAKSVNAEITKTIIL